MDLYIVVEESARLGPARLCKVILVGREGVRELGRDRLGLGCASRDVPARYMRLETISFGDSRGILHEGLVGVGARDIAPLTIKSVPQPRSYLNNACRVYEFFPFPGLYLGMTFILVDRGLTIPRPLMASVSFAELGVRSCMVPRSSGVESTSDAAVHHTPRSSLCHVGFSYARSDFDVAGWTLLLSVDYTISCFCHLDSSSCSLILEYNVVFLKDEQFLNPTVSDFNYGHLGLANSWS
ncbi:hypothetical protein BHM03_00031646 [Ensete ventricosum]|nr:hypothetical protein BHM03_00031646 [Ensete ventricosum]